MSLFDPLLESKIELTADVCVFRKDPPKIMSLCNYSLVPRPRTGTDGPMAQRSEAYADAHGIPSTYIYI